MFRLSDNQLKKQARLIESGSLNEIATFATYVKWRFFDIDALNGRIVALCEADGIDPEKELIDPSRQAVQMPEGEKNVRIWGSTIGELFVSLKEFDRDLYPWASRFVMGLPLPSWQRPLCWSEKQEERFIESIWRGYDIGSYLINGAMEFTEDDTSREFSDVLLDGQQRLTAIEHYISNAFQVKDGAGVPRYWGELPRNEQIRFRSTKFQRATIDSWDEQELREAYDRRSFGGVPHEESERASTMTMEIEPQPSTKSSILKPE